MNEFTHILERVEQGDPKAAGELLPIVYEELRRLAAQKMTREAAGHTLQPTALLHEAWMRLDIEAAGDDEHDATRAVERVFSSHDADGASGSVTERNL